jgi:GT2 family glycosyltransferase
MSARAVARVAICIITYKREAGLERLIRSLNELEFRRSPQPEIQIVVVDNDPLGSGFALAEELRPELVWILVSEIEPRRGIPYARNSAVAAADSDSDYIVFIDDDEIPEPYWLDELLSVQAEFNADIVTGPVLPHFMGPLPVWLRAGGFFQRDRPPTGTVMGRAGTGNVLIRRAVFQIGGFDERLALTGGEDTLFFRRARRAGFEIRFATDAVVHEWVPESRANARWLLQRAYRIGNTMSICDLALSKSPATILRRLLQVIERLVVGVVSIPFALCFTREHYKVCALRGARKVCIGAGMLAGLVGWRYKEYAKTHRV